MTQHETNVVQQFVAGTLPLGGFVERLHQDLSLRDYLASGGGLEAYVQADLLGQLLRTSWQDVVAVRQMQQLLEQFLRDQGVDVDPTGLYQERVDFLDRSRSLLAALQPPWLKIPVPYFAVLLKECGDQADGDLEDLMRRRIEARFRFLTDPPRWLHDEYWPVGRHGPLVFVEQIDIDGPGTAVNYVFVDPRDGAFLVLPQTRSEPSGPEARPEPSDVRLPRGVVPVHARPGAFWLPLPQVPPHPAPGSPTGEPARDDGPTGATGADEPSGPAGAAPSPVEAVDAEGDESSAPSTVGPVPVGGGAPSDPSATEEDASSGSTPAWPRTSTPRTEPIPSGAAVGSEPVVEQPVEQPSGWPGQPVVPSGLSTTVPVEPLEVAGPAPAPSVGSEKNTTVDLSFRPWMLVLSDGRTFAVESRSVVVGRRPQTDEPGVQVLAIADSTRSLSKTHARLELVDGTWQVTDLGSTNGVVVTTADGQETKADPGQPAPVYSYVAFGSVEARLQPDSPA